MAKITISCPDCRQETTVTVGQVAHPDGIRWFQSINCHHCGLAIESDEHGLTPDEIRDVLILTEGEWGLVLESKVTIHVLKVLRDLLVLPLREVKTAAQQPYLARGTTVEIKYIQNLLEQRHIHVSCMRITPP